MKKSELARHLDLMSDEVNEHEPDMIILPEEDRGRADALPTDGELLALRLGIVGALVWATEALRGETKPGDPVRDARRIVGTGIAHLVGEKLGKELEAADE